MAGRISHPQILHRTNGRGAYRQDRRGIWSASAGLAAAFRYQNWLVQLQTDHAPSYIYALHSRLAQLLADPVHDGVLARNPCSRRTAPRTGSQRPATTEQIWALHDAMEGRYGRACCWPHSPVCGLPKCADCEFPMWTSCAVSSHLSSSTRPIR
jgi:hypothetical protein